MKLCLIKTFLYLAITILSWTIWTNEASASNTQQSIPGGNVDIDHGDPPIGGGGVDGVLRSSGSDNDQPKPNVRGRRGSKAGASSSQRPTP